MMSEYLLMNKDSKLVRFSVSDEPVRGEHEIEEIERYVDENLLPPRFVNTKTWVDSRNYAKRKEHLTEWLSDWQLDNSLGFINVTHCLGLNDSLWVKKADSELTWESVNLYNNDFFDVVSQTSFEKDLHGLKLQTTSPEFTSEGSFEKCWIKEDDGIFLYKKGSSGFANAGKEMYSEFYAMQYVRALCKSYVEYELVMFKGSLVSRCPMFTTENEGFVPIYKYLMPGRKYTVDDVLRLVEPYGFEDDFRRMMVLDSVIFNVDRHFGNFGFVVDNDTFKVKRFAPVFDHNMSMLARAMKMDLVEDSPYILELGHTIGGDFVEMGKAVLNDDIRKDLEKLIDVPLVRHSEYNLDEDRLAFLDHAVQRQIRGIAQNNV